MTKFEVESAQVEETVPILLLARGDVCRIVDEIPNYGAGCTALVLEMNSRCVYALLLDAVIGATFVDVPNSTRVRPAKSVKLTVTY